MGKNKFERYALQTILWIKLGSFLECCSSLKSNFLTNKLYPNIQIINLHEKREIYELCIVYILSEYAGYGQNFRANLFIAKKHFQRSNKEKWVLSNHNSKCLIRNSSHLKCQQTKKNLLCSQKGKQQSPLKGKGNVSRLKPRNSLLNFQQTS